MLNGIVIEFQDYKILIKIHLFIILTLVFMKEKALPLFLSRLFTKIHIIKICLKTLFFIISKQGYMQIIGPAHGLILNFTEISIVFPKVTGEHR